VDSMNRDSFFTSDPNDSQIFDILKNMWAENGDILSKQYAGTGSTITTVTRTGKQGVWGKLTHGMMSFQRFLQNNLDDDFKHECIKLLLNQHPKQKPYGIKESLEKQMLKYQHHFKGKDRVQGCVFTWNLAGNIPSPAFDISNILYPEDPNIIPDFFVVGLQEMVKLNAKSVIQGKDKQRIQVWEQIIGRSLQKRARYMCISKKAMVGCLIMLFAKDGTAHRVKNVKCTKVKTGFGGQSGNKGAVNLRFTFDDTSFLFVNCHLASGQSNVNERLDDLRDIYRRVFDSSQGWQEYSVADHQYKFIFGDLNFRISMPDQMVRDEIKRFNFERLWETDQLLMNRSTNAILANYQEGPLSFAPTYKYDDHSEQYDTS